MNTVIWIIQILLAVAFFSTGLMKWIQPKEKLAERMAWVNDFSLSTVRAIGTAEMLGGIGLVLPALSNILPTLTPLAAGGLVLVMLGAIATHMRRQEYTMIVLNLVLLGFAAFILYGRVVAVPI